MPIRWLRIVAGLSAVIPGVVGAELSATCATTFREAGAVPGTPSCTLDAASGRVGLDNYFCYVPDTIDRYCAGAGDDSPPPEGAAVAPEEAINAGAPGCMGVGNPIHVATGNKYQREVDIAPVRAHGMRFVRHYNSALATPGAPAWRHTYQRELVLTAYAYVDEATGETRRLENTVRLVRPDGRTLFFYRLGPRTLAPLDGDIPAGVPAVGAASQPLEWTGEAWRYRPGGGVAEYYDAAGALTRIVAPSGAVQYIERTASGAVSAVRDDAGRRLSFHYDADGRLVALEREGGGTYAYDYDAAGRLTRVTAPDGGERRYHYTGEAALTGITDANGDRYATWRYDDAGRAVVSVHADGAERTELDFNDDGTTTVTNALGKRATYHFRTLRGRREVTRIEGQPSADCAAATKAFTYTPEGWVATRTDWQGTTTAFEYNERGLVTRQVEAVGTPAERVTTTQWHPELRRPVRVDTPERTQRFTYDAAGRLTSRRISANP